MAGPVFTIVHAHMPTASSYIDFTSSGIGTPVAAIIRYGYGTSEGTLYNNAQQGRGFYDGTNQVSIGTYQADGLTTTNTATITRGDAALILPNLGNSTPRNEYTASWITDGLRLTKVSATTALYCTVVLITGDVTAAVGSMDLGAFTSPHTYSQSGLDPSIMWTFTQGHTTEDSWRTDAVCSHGVAGKHEGGSVVQKCFAFYSDDNNGTSVLSARGGSVYVGYEMSSGGQTGPIQVTDMSSSGVEMTWSSTSAWVFYLSLELDDPSTVYIPAHDYIDASSTSYTSEVAGRPIKFASMEINDFDGLWDTNVTTSLLGAATTYLTPDYTASHTWRDYDGQATSDVNQQRNSSADGSTWEFLKNASATTATATVALDDDHISMSSIVGWPTTRDPLMYAAYILGGVTNVFEGSTKIVGVYEGSTEITAMYEGTTQIY